MGGEEKGDTLPNVRGSEGMGEKISRGVIETVMYAGAVTGRFANRGRVGGGGGEFRMTIKEVGGKSQRGGLSRMLFLHK